MKKLIIFGAGFLIGGGAGAGIAYYFTKKKIQNECQEDINKMKEEFKKKSQDGKSEKEDKKEETKEESTDDEDPAEKKARYSHVNKVPDKPVPDKYKNLTKTYAADDGNDRSDADDVDPAEEEFPEEDRPRVEIISVDEFEEINHGFEHTTVLYYTQDETLAYEDSELIDNEKYLFENALSMDDAWDDDHLYVRNNAIGEMFDIQKIDAKYGDLN